MKKVERERKKFLILKNRKKVLMVEKPTVYKESVINCLAEKYRCIL